MTFNVDTEVCGRFAITITLCEGVYVCLKFHSCSNVFHNARRCAQQKSEAAPQGVEPDGLNITRRE